ncbi:MAG: YggS family pyridoxal phosphate-dependent enzyme [Candidatus Neomarinimicrobiota bacterium]
MAPNGNSEERSRISANWNRLNDQIAATTTRIGRVPETIKIVTVGKTFPVAILKAAMEVGIRVFGENRVQEAAPKIEFFRNIPDIEWHMIGHLQTNKAKKAAELFNVIQSVDSVRLAQLLSTEGGRLGRTIPVFIEINTSGESAKSGMAPDALFPALDEIAVLPNIAVSGLMTVGPLTDDVGQIRHAFRQLKKLYDRAREQSYPNCHFERLSMGMSGDFEIAIEEGSTMIRVGRAIFGERGAA